MTVIIKLKKGDPEVITEVRKIEKKLGKTYITTSAGVKMSFYIDQIDGEISVLFP